MATIHSLASDIASRIPEMARDSQTNNQALIESLLSTFLNQREAQAMATYIPIRSQGCDSAREPSQSTPLVSLTPEPFPQIGYSGSSR